MNKRITKKQQRQFRRFLRTIRIREDDVLVFKSESMISNEGQQYIKDALKTVFPKNNCMVVCGDNDLVIIRKEDK